jgi:hypothetical protein
VTRRGAIHALGQLTDRDHTILDWLYDHKIMTTVQWPESRSATSSASKKPDYRYGRGRYYYGSPPSAYLGGNPTGCGWSYAATKSTGTAKQLRRATRPGTAAGSYRGDLPG